MKKFRKAFLMNPNFRFDTSSVKELAEEHVYLCDAPMFDNLIGPENRKRFEPRVAEALKDFNFYDDVIVVYGDPIIFAMAILFVSLSQPEFSVRPINVARWSAKEERYLVRQISEEFFPEINE